jgi:hypothetical protein
MITRVIEGEISGACEGRPEYDVAFPGDRDTRDMTIRCSGYGLAPLSGFFDREIWVS